MTVREYALHLLKENDCELDCYKGEDGEKYALRDMQEYAKENEVLFPLEYVAAELIAIGNEQPDPPRNGHKKYCMVFETSDTDGGLEFDTYEEAKADMENTYIGWEEAESYGWAWETDFPNPTPDQIESWDQMIDECYCYIVEWNEELGEYDDSYYGAGLTDEELREIDWDYWANIRRDWK